MSKSQNYLYDFPTIIRQPADQTLRISDFPTLRRAGVPEENIVHAAGQVTDIGAQRVPVP